MSTQTIFSPAKLNLFLAITGRRSDGFHDLVSVVTPLCFGDTLQVEKAPEGFTLTCSDPDVPCDGSNLVLKAAAAFAEATGWRGGARFRLEKRTPMGAGMGGGSSNAVAALRGLNTLAGAPLDRAGLLGLAAQLGSDCPLFLHDGPVVMRGRGERIEALAPSAARRLSGRRVLVFKPGFGVPTAWAYRRMADEAAAGAEGVYLAPALAEKRLADWLHDDHAEPGVLLYNNMERPAFSKFIALPTMVALLERQFGLAVRMTGSGSACFALLPEGVPVDQVVALIRDGWGEKAVIADTQLA